MKAFNQKGFSIVELVIVVAIVAIIGLLGFNVYNRSHRSTANDSSGTAQAAKVDNVATAPLIKTTGDLDKAEAVLDQTDLSGSNSSDSSQLDSQLSAF